MTELWLKFTDEKGDEKRVAVTGEKFTVGRHSAAGLCIPDGRLSREHVRIERFGDVFVVSDRDSSNGTTINGEKLIEPVGLKNEDVLDLGGVMITVEIESDQPAADSPDPEPPAAAPGASAPTASAAAAGSKKGGMSMTALLLIPMFGIVILLFAGVIVYVVMSRNSGKPGTEIVINNPDDIGDENNEDDPVKTSTPKTNPQTGPTVPGGQIDQPGGPTGSPVPISETAVVEESAAKFLRQIADNNPTAFLTTDQAKRVDSRLKSFKGSSGLAANIAAAKKNAKDLTALAEASSLKPHFVAVAAIAKLGNTRGDIVAAAQSMTAVLNKLKPQIGTDQADDSLLMIAAFDQGSAGDTMKMRNMLQDLANKNPESTREIRTIWFLEKEGKITKTEFDRALTFLAIGTITQNPKAFGVNAEALNL